MKKICALIFLLILIPNILAVSIDMKTEYSQGETLIATISGTFAEPISKQDIIFYRDHVKIPFVFNFQKIKGEYHLYAQLLGKNQGNYSFRIEDAKYMELGQIIEKEIRSNFTISDTTADFYVEEGYLQVEDDFTLKVQSLSSEDITITISTGEIVVSETEDEESSGGLFASFFGGSSEESPNISLENSIELISGQEKSIEFDLDQFENLDQAEIILTSDNTEYIIPLYFSEEVEAYEEESNKLRFQPQSLEITLSTNSSTQRIIHIENYGEVVIENITLSLSNNLENYTNLSVENINDIEDNSSFKITLNIFPSQEEISLNGELNMVFNNNSKSMPLMLDIVAGYIPDDEDNGENNPDDGSSIKTCGELEGEICKSYEECSENITYATDGNCCLAECNQKPASSTGKIIGWIILIILIGIVYWFIKTKYRGASRKINLLKIAKGKK